MDSNLLIKIHAISALLFLITYVIKTVLLFANKKALANYSKATKVPEMIISFSFLATGIWLYIIIGGIKYLQIIKLVFVIISIPLAVIGFKKQQKGMALFSLLLIIGAYGLAEASKTKPFIPAEVQLNIHGESSLAEGAVVYQSNCAFCHGVDGKKMYRLAPNLSISGITEDEIKQIVHEGSKSKMPSYNIIISDENIAAVAKYVMSLRTTIQAQPAN